MQKLETESFLALYKAQVSRADSHETTSSFMIEDPGFRENFIVHALAEKLELPSKHVTASIKMP